MIERVGRNGRRRLRWWPASVVVLALVFAGGLFLPRLTEAKAPVAAPVPGRDVAAQGTAPSAPAPVAPSASASAAPAPDLLRIPGRVPTKGKGTFSYASGRSRVFGGKGSLRRYRVAVERGSGEDVAAVAAQVDATLGDARSWIGGGLRLQRVSGAESYDFTVYLATRDTAGQMCARGGVNITVGGRPYTSCRATGEAIINLDRWRLSASTYVKAKVPLTTYRHYVINHEVGHELGHGHQGCPKRGGPAPVMVQQTLTLRGCMPYAWPRRGTKQLVGPSL